MRTLSLALLADGRSDLALEPIIRWVMLDHRPKIEVSRLYFRARQLQRSLLEEIRATIESFAPDILFVHRDAERMSWSDRRTEIPEGVDRLVGIVPVRMTEAWLLFDEEAIRRSAGRPRGRVSLSIPPLRNLEDLPDPKTRLYEALIAASEASGRRKAKIVRDLPVLVARVAQSIDSFAPLRQLPAFRQFEDEARRVLDAIVE